MDLDAALLQLEAAAEPSRLRLLTALVSGEATVGDLVTVLGQSQPRVSRHLRVLADAGLVESFREGRAIFYRLSATARDEAIGQYVAALGRGGDATLEGDRARLRELRRQRERDVLRHFVRRKALNEQSLPAGFLEEHLAEALDDVLGEGPLGDILDVGTGSGAVIRLLAPRARRMVGVDAAPAMRQLARARLSATGLPARESAPWTIRDADARALPFETQAFDLVVLDEVLGTGDSAAILREALRVLKPAGRLLVIDRILMTDAGLDAQLAALGWGITRRQWLPGRDPDRAVILAVPSDESADFAGASPPARTGTDD